MFLTMGHEPVMAELEAQYLQVVALGAVFKLVSTAMAQFLLGLHRRPVDVRVLAVDLARALV